MRCISPYIGKEGDRKDIPFPCGRCVACLKRKGSEWSFRLMQQDKTSITSYFITLTYDTSFVPISQNGFMSLQKVHCSDFFKRVRSAHDRAGLVTPECDAADRIKYFVVGEYGGKRVRPHYHAICFNFELGVMFSKEDLLVLEHTDFDGEAHVYCHQWKFGHCTVGKVTGASIGYCLKYMMKPGRIPMHVNDDRQREFRLMSKRLGRSYITDEVLKWHKDKLCERVYIGIEDGKKIPMSRYFKDKIYNDEERDVLQKYFEKKGVEDYQKILAEFGGDYNKMKHCIKQGVEAELRKLHRDALQGRDKM